MATPARRSTGDLLRAGVRAVSKYTGTLLAVFVVQSLVALGFMVVVALLLAQVFAHLPLFDDAVDGSPVALIWSVRFARSTFIAIACLLFGSMLLWQLASWFLVGGINGVFAQQPEGRGETARCFGASGATTYLKYVRLSVCALPGYVLVLFLLFLGMGLAAPHIEFALTTSQLVGPLVLAALPAVLLLHVLWTVADYARVELTLRHESHDPGVFFTYARSFAYVVKRPMTLLHAGIGWILFALLTAAYAYLADGHPMYGAGGAITLFFVRQGVSLLRMAVKIGVLAGQVEQGRTRALPPRRAEVSVDAKG